MKMFLFPLKQFPWVTQCIYIDTYLILDPMFSDRKKLAYNKRENKAVSDLNQSFMKVPEKNPNTKNSQVQVIVWTITKI